MSQPLPKYATATRIELVGTRSDMKEALAFAAEGKVKANIETTTLDDVNGVLDRLRTGKVTGRVVLKIIYKCLHDEMNSAVFDEFGRMSANLGLEAPGATPLTKNIILYPYINPPTELLTGIELPNGSLKVTPIASAADGTQIWKLTHNGVDTHPLHFHLFNVQLLNRITWDNRVLPPDANELGWKETVRVSPLEDTIVALRPIVPKIPFGIPDSKRPLNPAMPLGNADGFNNVDPLGNAITPGITNEITNFGWEYVWHCHILGHEEMDMMRPMVASVSRALPAVPALSYFNNGSVHLTWTDGTPADYSNPASWGNPANEIGFRIERATVANGTTGAFAVIGNALANQVNFTDVGFNQGTVYRYHVVAFNEAGNSVSNAVPPLPLTIAANNASRAYGANKLSFIANYNGFVDGDTVASLTRTLACSSTGTKTSPVGSYPITCSGLTSTKYAITYVAGSLTVTASPLTITANNASRSPGVANPSFTATYSGFVNGDTAASLAGTLSCTTTATINSPAGSYPITCSGQTSTNYNVSYVQGTLTVLSTIGFITSPTPGSVLPGASATFIWTPGTGAVTRYWLYVGSTVGGSQYFTQNMGLATQVTVNTLPTNGSTVYVRLMSMINGA